MTKVDDAKKALREAERQELEERYAEYRAEHGPCPKEYKHFDLASFVVGAAIAAWLAIFVAFLIVNLTR